MLKSRTALSEDDPNNSDLPEGRPTRFGSFWVAGPAFGSFWVAGPVDGFPREAPELPGGGSLPLVLISPRRIQRKSNVTSLTLKRGFKAVGKRGARETYRQARNPLSRS